MLVVPQWLKDGIEQILLEEVPGVIGVENIEEYLA